jgi:hypothetical protein
MLGVDNKMEEREDGRGPRQDKKDGATAGFDLHVTYQLIILSLPSKHNSHRIPPSCHELSPPAGSPYYCA